MSLFYMRNPVKRISALVDALILRRRQPLRLEFNVGDHCNLNCKGCTHYSPLAHGHFTDIDTLRHSIATLGAKCSGKVKTAYLIGGETLLYPHLKEAMTALREAFADARLYIFTNGLPIPGMDAEFWQLARDLRFTISITRYPIKFDYDRAVAICRENGVEVELFGDRSQSDSFFRFALDSEKKQPAKISHLKCWSFGCVTVDGDKIYPCSISACAGHLNRAFGTDFRHEKGDYLEVDAVRSSRDILKLRNRAVPFCGYCILPPASVTYGPSRRDINEWVDIRQ